jgi:NADH:ubiquinone oxidoreductase subunit E
MACPCSGAGELDFAPLKDILAVYREHPEGALIPVLQQAQEVYGYLPKPVLETIARELAVPVAEVFGVVTFYAQFHLAPRGKNIVRTCQGTACHVRGAAGILEAISKHIGVKPGQTTRDLSFTLETVACLGACGLAPVIMVNANTHGRLTPADIPGILDSYVS